MNERLCWTCSRVISSVDAGLCQRPYCAARNDVIREAKRQNGTRPPQQNPGEAESVPEIWDKFLP